MFKNINKEMFEPKRMVWMAGGPESAPPPTEAQKPLEQIDIKEKDIPAEKLQEVAKRIKEMNLPKIDLKTPNATEFRKSLAEAVDKDPKIKDLKIKNLDLFLVHGLLENLGKPNAKLSEIGFQEATALTKFLTEKKVVKYEIVNGYWAFYTKDQNNNIVPVKADYKLDDQDVREPGRPDSGTVGVAAVERAVIGSRVKAEQKKALEEKRAQEADTERKKPENMMKAKSKAPVELQASMQMGDLAGSLEASVTPEGGKPQVTRAEIEKALKDYIKAANIPGENEQKQFENFFKKIKEDGFTAVKIEEGKIGFIRNGQVNYNPSNLNRIVEGRPKPNAVYLTEQLRQQAESKMKAEDEKAKTDQEIRPTRLDDTEKKVAELLGEKDLSKIDKRYLGAMEKILAYQNGEPIKVELPFNDDPLKCDFFRSTTGTYVLKWKEGGYYEYNPKAKDPAAGLKEAQQKIAAELNDGSILRRIQYNNIRSKSALESRGIKLDSGPKEMPSGAVQYEFDWDTGALGDDPDVTITALAHGELAVKVEQSDIGINGEKVYEFRAGGYQDMIRVINSLKKWAEMSREDREKVKGDEEERRFFERGPRGLQPDATGARAGEIIRVNSVPSTIEAKMTQGYYLDFDWMQKLQPPRRLQVVKNADNSYDYLIIPGEMKLPVREVPSKGGFSSAMRVLAEWRNQETLKGGPEATLQKARELVEKYNKGPGVYAEVELRNNVKVTAVMGNTIYLSMGEGMAPKGFDFVTPAKDKDGNVIPTTIPGVEAAVREGYLLRGKPAEIVGQQPVAPERPADKIKVTVDSPETNPDRDNKAKAIQEIISKINNTVNRDRVNAYLSVLSFRMSNSETDVKVKIQKYKEEMWKGLGEYLKISPDPIKGEDYNKESYQKKVYALLNNPKDSEKIMTERTRETLGDSFKNYPRSRIYIDGLIRSFSVLDTRHATAAELNDLKKAYLDQVKVVVEDFLKTKKPGEQDIGFDKKMVEMLRAKLKLPKNFATEYNANEEKRDALKKYESDQKQEADKKKDYEDLRANPHGMSFTDFEKASLGGAAPEAWRVLKDTKILRKADINLARIQGNNTNSDPISFNVKVGKAGEVKPFTLTFAKKPGGTDIYLADGWNNRVYSQKMEGVKIDSAVALSKDPLKDIFGMVYGAIATSDGGAMESWAKDAS